MGETGVMTRALTVTASRSTALVSADAERLVGRKAELWSGAHGEHAVRARGTVEAGTCGREVAR